MPTPGGRAPGADRARPPADDPAPGRRAPARRAARHHPARTLLDLAATERPRRVARAVEAAEGRRIDFAPVHVLLAAHVGRPGTAVLRAALAAPPRRTESPLEDRLLDLVLAHGLPRPRVNALVGAHRVDLLWETERLVVEADGHEHHATRRAFQDDRRRDAALHVAGFTVVRFTWAHVVHDPGHVVATLRALLRARSTARGR